MKKISQVSTYFNHFMAKTIIMIHGLAGILLLLCAMNASAETNLSEGVVPHYATWKIYSNWHPVTGDSNNRTDALQKIVDKFSNTKVEKSNETGEFLLGKFNIINNKTPHHLSLKM